MARTKAKTYTLDELAKVRADLLANDAELVGLIRQYCNDGSFNGAVRMRDAAQRLLTIRMAHKDDGTLDTCQSSQVR